MPSFHKFIDFARNRDDLDADLLGRIGEFIFRNRNATIVSAVDLHFYADIPPVDAQRLLRSLAVEGVIRQLPVSCPCCDSLIEAEEQVLPYECPQCERRYDSIRVIRYEVSRVEPDYASNADIQSAHMVEAEIRNVIQVWEARGFAFYLLVDLVNSEPLQKKGDGQYNDFLEIMRDLMRTRVLSNCKDPHFFLGEIGDCMKLILTSPGDVAGVVRDLSQEIVESPSLADYRGLLQDESFPRFKMMVNTIRKPTESRTGKTVEISKVFRRTFNGEYDLNMLEITQLYRMESALKSIKKEYPYYHRDFNIAFWVVKDAGMIMADSGDIELPSSWIPLQADSRKYGDAALYLYRNGRGQYIDVADQS